MNVEKYWPGSLTWDEIAAKIHELPADRFGHEELSTVMQIVGLLRLFGFPQGSKFREEKRRMTDEQTQLIARILDGLVKAIPPLMPHRDDLGLLDVGRCRYCGAIGQVYNVFEIRHEHTDGCLLALNAQLQKSLQGDVLPFHNREEQG